MPLTVTDYSPSDVLAQLLIRVGQASDWLSSGRPEGEWPVSAGMEPDSPDSVITIYDTEGVGGVRDHITGVPDGPLGFQVRVRSTTHRYAWSKASAVYKYLSETLYRQGVSIGDRYYLVHSCDLFGDILSLGKESPNSQRSIVVFNATVNLSDQTP